MTCTTCHDDGIVTTPSGYERGCPACPAGDRHEEFLARVEARYNDLLDEATGQDFEAAGF